MASSLKIYWILINNNKNTNGFSKWTIDTQKKEIQTASKYKKKSDHPQK